CSAGQFAVETCRGATDDHEADVSTRAVIPIRTRQTKFRADLESVLAAVPTESVCVIVERGDVSRILGIVIRGGRILSDHSVAAAGCGGAYAGRAEECLIGRATGTRASFHVPLGRGRPDAWVAAFHSNGPA